MRGRRRGATTARGRAIGPARVPFFHRASRARRGAARVPRAELPDTGSTMGVAS
ncbi:hypothetical protein OH687_24635 [Burkholderia anthina]|nr:hypothetical protein OH687_24635 [Burkholderia anthina]